MFEKADVNGDGKLTPEEWQQVLNCSGVQATRLGKVCMASISMGTLFLFREEVDKFFVSMDRDFDGRLNFEEFMGEETKVEKLFKMMDKNGDGLVTKKVCKILQFYNIYISIFFYKEFMKICKNLSSEEVNID